MKGLASDKTGKPPYSRALRWHCFLAGSPSVRASLTDELSLSGTCYVHFSRLLRVLRDLRSLFCYRVAFLLRRLPENSFSGTTRFFPDQAGTPARRTTESAESN